jgi:hypothetical protein
VAQWCWSVLGPYDVGNRWSSPDTSGHNRFRITAGDRVFTSKTSGDAAGRGRVRIPPDGLPRAGGPCQRGRWSPRTSLTLRPSWWPLSPGLSQVGPRRPCPRTCPRYRSAAVIHGQQRSLTMAAELHQHSTAGGPRVLPELAVGIFVPFVFLLPKWPPRHRVSRPRQRSPPQRSTLDRPSRSACCSATGSCRDGQRQARCLPE